MTTAGITKYRVEQKEQVQVQTIFHTMYPTSWVYQQSLSGNMHQFRRQVSMQQPYRIAVCMVFVDKFIISTVIWYCKRQTYTQALVQPYITLLTVFFSTDLFFNGFRWIQPMLQITHTKKPAVITIQPWNNIVNAIWIDRHYRHERRVIQMNRACWKKQPEAWSTHIATVYVFQRDQCVTQVSIILGSGHNIVLREQRLHMFIAKTRNINYLQLRSTTYLMDSQKLQTKVI